MHEIHPKNKFYLKQTKYEKIAYSFFDKKPSLN